MFPIPLLISNPAIQDKEPAYRSILWSPNDPNDENDRLSNINRELQEDLGSAVSR